MSESTDTVTRAYGYRFHTELIRVIHSLLPTQAMLSQILVQLSQGCVGGSVCKTEHSIEQRLITEH